MTHIPQQSIDFLKTAATFDQLQDDELMAFTKLGIHLPTIVTKRFSTKALENDGEGKTRKRRKGKHQQ